MVYNIYDKISFSLKILNKWKLLFLFFIFLVVALLTI